jgi:hypothetical protein
MRLGYEIFYTTPGKVSEMRCRVCGSICDVERDVYGPSNFAQAVNKINDLYDVFTCPIANRDWHAKALNLVIAIEEMPSKRVADLMKQDLEDLLKENGIL